MSEVRSLYEITADRMNSRKRREGKLLHSGCEDPLTRRRKTTISSTSKERPLANVNDSHGKLDLGIHSRSNVQERLVLWQY